MQKSLEQLRKEQAELQKKFLQEQHRLERTENRIRYFQKGDRQKRAHRLITKGAAIESIAPQTRDMDERTFYALMEKVFELPEVGSLLESGGG